MMFKRSVFYHAGRKECCGESVNGESAAEFCLAIIAINLYSNYDSIVMTVERIKRGERMDKLGKALARVVDAYSRQGVCEVCGGKLVFQGCGEYVCEQCGDLSYDDYGKVRRYVETHAGASVTDTAEATGVSQDAIREMIKERKIRIGY